MFTMPGINGQIERGNSIYILKNHIALDTGGYSCEIADVFANRIHSKCGKTCIINDGEYSDICLSTDSSLGNEKYAIEIGETGIRLTAGSEQGMRWALTTLFQLIAEAVKKSDGKLEGCRFEDYPKYSYRGLMLDVSRHFFDAAEVKKIIEEISINKLNVLHWHLSDDQGWRIESKVHPKLNSGGPFYTQEEIRDIVNFAAARGVEIVPEIDMPGHSRAMIASYPELSCFNEKIDLYENGGISKVIMCAGKESTYEWIYQLLDEIVYLFQSSRIHLGGDEVPKDKWKECPHCNRVLSENQLSNYEELQFSFMQKLVDYLGKKGKTVICWNDILRAKKPAKNMQIQYWIEATDESYSSAYFNEGQNMIFSDIFSMYFDYPYSVVRLEKTYNYNPGIRDQKNLTGENVMGIEGAIWTERVETMEVLEAMISPRIQALAEAAWTYNRDYEGFLGRLKIYFSELNLNSLQPTPLENATICGEEAEMQAKEFIQAFLGILTSPDSEINIPESELKNMLGLFLNNIFSTGTAAELLKSSGM